MGDIRGQTFEARGVRVVSHGIPPGRRWGSVVGLEIRRWRCFWAEGDGVAGSKHVQFVQMLVPCMTYDGGDESD